MPQRITRHAPIPGQPALHPDHGVHRCARHRPHAAGAAGPGRRAGRLAGTAVVLVRRAAGDLRPGAVPRHALAGRAQRPLRPAAGAAAVHLRSRRGLPDHRHHGFAADPGAVAPAQRRHQRQLHRRQRLCRRHHHAGRTQQGFRRHRCRVRARLHRRAHAWRPARGKQPAPAVLGRRRHGAAELAVRLVRAAGVAAAGTPGADTPGQQRQSVRGHEASVASGGRSRAGGGLCAGAAGAMADALDLGALHQFPLRLDPARQRHRALPVRPYLGAGAWAAARPAAAQAG
ncbi:UNVERIFIED_CONTAM: hypothetical protein NCL1_01397 [Trichonephila clavipes]